MSRQMGQRSSLQMASMFMGEDRMNQAAWHTLKREFQVIVTSLLVPQFYLKTGYLTTHPEAVELLGN